MPLVEQAGFEPATSANVFAATLPLSYCPLCYGCTSIAQFEGGAGLPRYAPAPGIFRSQEPQEGFEPYYVMRPPNQDVPRPRHRAAAYLRAPSVRLSSVTDFRFATAFSPCGGAGLSRLSSCRFCVCFNTDDERLPRVRIPIRFRGVSRASTLWAYLWARIRSVRAVAL